MIKLTNKNMILVGSIVVGLVFSIFFLNKIFGKEGYTDIVRKIYDENNTAAEKYESQDVRPNESTGKQMGDAVDINVKNDQELTQVKKMVDEPLQPNELLPGLDQDASKFFENAAPQTSGSLEHKNFIEAAHHIGVDTQNSTMKNANRQIRSDPPVPQDNVSVWNNSTIQQDPFRKHFEIGQ